MIALSEWESFKTVSLFTKGRVYGFKIKSFCWTVPDISIFYQEENLLDNKLMRLPLIFLLLHGHIADNESSDDSTFTAHHNETES